VGGLLRTRDLDGNASRVVFVNENIGGHATMHLHLFRALAEHPEVAVERLDVPHAGLARRAFSARIPGLDRLDLDLSPLRDQLGRSAHAHALLRRRLASEPVAAIHAYSQHVALLSTAELRRVPSVVSTDGSSRQNAGHLPYRRPTRYTRGTAALTERLERRVFDAATIVVAQSEWAAASIRDRHGLDDKRLRIIPLGLMPFEPAEPRERGPLQITFVGNTLDRKGGTRLLRVFRQQLRGRCILNIVTRDPIATEPGVRVFRTFVPGDPRLVQLLAETAVFVLPTEIDKSPYAIVEAMFAGVPVVATRCGAIPELVEHGTTGLLVDHDDDALAAAIVSLLDSEPDRERMGAAARSRALARYDARDTTAQLVAVIDEAREQYALV
jgi:glycosyltransferase involved in cell wall biosynthesis